MGVGHGRILHFPFSILHLKDAHGANAEWYEMVCSNVFSKIEQSNNPNNQPMLLPNGESVYFKSGINTNAYYFVDVIAERGPAPIYFNSSHPGRLGSPIVVALGGETNRVPMLIGATYSITSDVPFTVLCPTNGFAEVLGSDCTSATVKWPLEFTFTEELTGTSRSYTVGVEPYNPGGTFSWGGGQGGASLQGVQFPAAGGTCGCCSANGSTIVYGCSPSCACGGNCFAVGTFNFEQALFSVTGGVCRCGFEDPGFDYSFEPSSSTGPFVDVAFSKPAVIFEEAFENAIGVMCPRRSTRVRLKLTAYGGVNGGRLTFLGTNLEKLLPVSGGEFSLPEEIDLAPYEYFVTNYFCEGTSPSLLAPDVLVDGNIVESVTGACFSDDDSLTVMRVELTPRRQAPDNPCAHRHSFGVFELVDCGVVPNVPGVMWQLHGGGTDSLSIDGYLDVSGGTCVLRCPLTNNNARLEFCSSGVRYCPIIDYVEPTNIVPERVDYRFPGSPPRGYNEAGDIALWVYLYIYPKTVNFEEIALEEVPWSQGGGCTGFFATPEQASEQYHDEYHGAGTWRNVTSGNYWSVDRVGKLRIANWTPGSLIWDIPIGWNRLNTSRGTLPVENVGMFQAKFEIFPDGTVRVDKFGKWVSRGLSTNPEGPDNGRVLLDGEERNVQQDIIRWLNELNQGAEEPL